MPIPSADYAAPVLELELEVLAARARRDAEALARAIAAVRFAGEDASDTPRRARRRLAALLEQTRARWAASLASAPAGAVDLAPAVAARYAERAAARIAEEVRRAV